MNTDSKTPPYRSSQPSILSAVFYAELLNFLPFITLLHPVKEYTSIIEYFVLHSTVDIFVDKIFASFEQLYFLITRAIFAFPLLTLRHVNVIILTKYPFL